MNKIFISSLALFVIVSHSILCQSIDEFNYTINNEGTITITGYVGTAKEITIPVKINNIQVTSIGRSAFRNNENITSVTIPYGVIKIEYGAFYECYNLLSVILPDSLQEIEKFAFEYCYNLSKIILPEGIKTIEQGVFNYCRSLEIINIPASITYIDGNAYLSAFYYCKKLKQINVNVNNTVYSSISGILYNKEKTTLLYCPEGYEGVVIVPHGIESIHNGAFRHNNNVTEIILPKSVVSIGAYAFGDCKNLERINIHSNIDSILYSAFNECNNLDISIKEDIFKRYGDVFSSQGH